MIKLLLFIATLILILAIACATPSPIPSPFVDSANLAVHPDIDVVVIGQALEELGDEVVPVADSPNRVRYGHWSIKVDRYLVNPFPYSEIKVRIIKEFVRPDGSTAPVLYPLPSLISQGADVIFFLSRYSVRNETPLTGDNFALRIGPLGHESQRLIENGQVSTIRNGVSNWEPLKDFLDRVVFLASQAGLPTEGQAP